MLVAEQILFERSQLSTPTDPLPHSRGIAVKAWEVLSSDEKIKLTNDKVHELFDFLEEKFDDVTASFKNVNERFDGVEQRLEAMDNRFDGVEQRLEAMDNRFDGVEQRLGAMDLHFEAMDNRFDMMEQRLESVEQRLGVMELHFEAMDNRFDMMEQRFDRMEQRFDRMDSRFDKMEQEFEKIQISMSILSGHVMFIENTAFTLERIQIPSDQSRKQMVDVLERQTRVTDIGDDMRKGVLDSFTRFKKIFTR